jgi:curved DNA-binding protein CbpA
MSVIAPFEEARRLLGVGIGEDPAVIKRAYRREVLAHPPDRDPEGFRRVRSAYELLIEPGERAREILLHSQPAIEAPPLRAPGAAPPVAATALALLRVLAARVDVRALLQPTGKGLRS